MIDERLAALPDIDHLPDTPEWQEPQPDPFRGGFRYYDRLGNGISMADWCKGMEDLEYKRVAYTEVGPYQVSTVWLGLDHGYGQGRPVIFETMVFEAEPSWSPPLDFQGQTLPGFWYNRDQGQWRYCTEEEALRGHADILEQIKLISDLASELPPESLT